MMLLLDSVRLSLVLKRNFQSKLKSERKDTAIDFFLINQIIFCSCALSYKAKCSLLVHV